MSSLKDFASSKSAPATRCKTCNLPAELRAQVEEGHIVNGISLTTVSEWLDGENHPIGAQTLHNHFRHGHAKRSGDAS